MISDYVLTNKITLTTAFSYFMQLIDVHKMALLFLQFSSMSSSVPYPDRENQEKTGALVF